MRRHSERRSEVAGQCAYVITLGDGELDLGVMSAPAEHSERADADGARLQGRGVSEARQSIRALPADLDGAHDGRHLQSAPLLALERGPRLGSSSHVSGTSCSIVVWPCES